MSDTPAPDNVKPERPAWQAAPAAEVDADEQPLPTLDDAPVVKWLLILNIAVYVLNDMLPHVRVGWGGNVVGLLTYFGNFNVPQGVNGLQLWRLFTYQFLHGNLVHIGLNMMALYVFGPMMEQWWGRRRFLAFYLLCGACGAWLMALLAYTPMVDARTAWLVGASGSIFGILVGVALAYPQVEVKLMIPPIWLTVRKLAVIFLALSVGQIFFGYNTGGNAAHLGGAFFGFILMRRPWSLDFADKNAPKLEPISASPKTTDDDNPPPDNNPPTS